MFYYPYQIIEKRLMAQVSGLKEVDWYMGQDQTGNKGSRLLCTAPGAYIEFPSMNPESYDLGEQRGDGTFTVYLVTESMKDNRDRLGYTSPLGHAKLMDAINRALHGFAGYLSYVSGTENRPIFTSLQRNGLVPPHQSGDLLVSKQTFHTCFFDYSSEELMQPFRPNGVDIGY